MKEPFIIVNFKTFEEATGKKALELAKLCERVAKGFKVEIAVAPQATDIREIAENVSIPVFCQHIDPIKSGAYTGHILGQAVQMAGAIGVLINHSEKQVTIEQASKIIDICKELGLISVYCTASPVNIDRIRKYSPDYIAYEPPELIGGAVSVSTAKPKVITESISRAKEIHLIVGAGIKTGYDVRKALELGAKGVLIASGVCKAEDPEKELISFAEALKE